MIENTVSLCAL